MDTEAKTAGVEETKSAAAELVSEAPAPAAAPVRALIPVVITANYSDVCLIFRPELASTPGAVEARIETAAPAPEAPAPAPEVDEARVETVDAAASTPAPATAVVETRMETAAPAPAPAGVEARMETAAPAPAPAAVEARVETAAVEAATDTKDKERTHSEPEPQPEPQLEPQPQLQPQPEPERVVAVTSTLATAAAVAVATVSVAVSEAAAAKSASETTPTPTPTSAYAYFDKLRSGKEFTLFMLLKNEMFGAAVERACGSDDGAAEWRDVCICALGLVGTHSEVSIALESVKQVIRSCMSSPATCVAEMTACLFTLQLLRQCDFMSKTAAFDSSAYVVFEPSLKAMLRTADGAVLVCQALRIQQLACAAQRSFAADIDVAVSVLDVMLGAAGVDGKGWLKGVGAMAATVTAMRVAAVNFHLASMPDIAELLKDAFAALDKAWRTSLDTVVPFVVHGGVDVLVDVLNNVAHAFVTEDMARQCVVLMETFLLKHMLTMLLEHEMWRVAACVAKTASQFMANARIAKPCCVVLSTIFRITSQSKKMAWASESAALSAIGVAVVEAYKEYHGSSVVVGDYRTMAWHAATLMYDYAAFANAADALTLLRAPQLLLDDVSAATTTSKPASNAFLYCATLGRVLANTHDDMVPLTMRCHIVEAVLALLGVHGGASLLLARAAAWALVKMCVRDATLATFVAGNGVFIVSTILADHAKRVPAVTAADEKKDISKLTANVATLETRVADYNMREVERIKTGIYTPQYDF